MTRSSISPCPAAYPTQRQSVLDALELVRCGLDARRIHDVLMAQRLEASIYITVDTLKYLKKGGRVTAAGAAIGTVLGIKPVLQIQGDKLDAFAKARGWKSAKKIMLDAMERDVTERFAGKEVHLGAAYTCSDQEALAWKQEIQERFPGRSIHMDRLPRVLPPRKYFPASRRASSHEIHEFPGRNILEPVYRVMTASSGHVQFNFLRGPLHGAARYEAGS